MVGGKIIRLRVYKSNLAHKNSLNRINKIKSNKAGFYKRGEFERLEKKRIYHIAVLNKQASENKILNRNQKKSIWKKIKISQG